MTKKRCEFKSEYARLAWYTDNRPNVYMREVYRHFGDSIQLNSAQTLNLKIIKFEFIEDVKYLILHKEYCDLLSLSDDKLSYDDDGFHLDGHTFETLKEVRKAIKNKAFL
jgi:hypothetical protein